jgi:hypothetical protein
MPTRFVETNVLKRAFDVLVPPGTLPKELLRWKELSRKVGLGEHWLRKRYHGIVQSELDLRSIDLIRKALSSIICPSPTRGREAVECTFRLPDSASRAARAS